MAEVVNLRLIRKAKARVEAEQQASENRARFGQSRTDRDKHRADTERDRKRHDGAKRED